MNFSGVSSKGLPGRLLRMPLKLIPSNTVVPILQGPLKGKKWIVGSSTHGCWLGSYEFDKQQRFIDEVNEGDLVYDIGAHVGYYTLLASVLVGGGGRVIAFEPYPPNVAFLKRHLALNTVANATLYDKALSDKSGYLPFEVGSSSSMGHLSDSDEAVRSVRVETVVIDDFVTEMQLPMPTVLKIDIEGAEARFLQGATQILSNRPVRIFLATHGPEVHAQCLSILTNLGYIIESLDTQPVETTSELYAFRPA